MTRTRHQDPVGPPWGARRVAGLWDELARPTRDPRPVGHADLSSLPGPVERWLRGAVPDGTPLTTTAVLGMSGSIRLGQWRPFSARQVLATDGFVWSAAARVGTATVTGYDRYAHGVGEMRWRLLGMVPVMTATGPDVTRSAAGRLAAERFLVPTSALDDGVRWVGEDGRRATARVEVDGTSHEVEVEVDDGDRLVGVRMSRWGNPAGLPFGEHPFVVRLDGQVRLDGVVLPERVEAGWQPDGLDPADGVFFRAHLRTLHRR